MGKKKLAYINKDMLVWARNTTPFTTPEDVESRFPTLSAEDITKWESGEELPSITEAKELAKRYKLPFACFYLPKCPDKQPKKSYTDRRTFTGSSYGVMSYELWEEIERVKSDRETMLEYYKNEEYGFEDLPKLSLDASIEDIVFAIREFFELPLSFKNKTAYKNNSFNYYRLKIESKGVIVAQISGVDLCEMKGLSIYDDVFPIVAINNKDYERAKTFSLFHEVAHLIRRSSSLCLINDDERNDEEEKICDSIAAEILMDTNEFRNIAAEIYSSHNEWSDIALSQLADRFGVSVVSAFRRLYDLDIIGRNYYFERYKEISNSFEAVLEKIKKAQEGKNIPFFFHVRFINAHGHLLPKVVLSAHYSGKISIGETCRILNVKSKYIGDLSRAVAVL